MPSESDLIMNKSLKEIDSTECAPPCGLTNPSIFCYMNASLQCLLSIGSLVKYYREKCYRNNKNQNTISRNQKASTAFRSIIKHMFQAGRYKYIEGDEIRSVMSRFLNPQVQQDAHEFIIKFLSLLQDEENSKLMKPKNPLKTAEEVWLYYKSFNRSLIDELFAGLYSNEVRCHQCNNVSFAYDPFIDINLPISSDEDENRKSMLSLMNKFFMEEVINYLDNSCIFRI